MTFETRSRTVPPLLQGAIPMPKVYAREPVLGIDASASKVGYALMAKGLLKTWKFTPRKTGVRRIEEHYAEVQRIIRQYGVKHVAKEGYAFGARNSQAQTTGECGGAVRMGVMHAGVRNLLIVPPNSMKMFVTGNGNAAKNTIPLALYKKYGVEVTDEDEADAAGLCAMAVAFWGLSENKLLKYEKKSLEKLRDEFHGKSCNGLQNTA